MRKQTKRTHYAIFEELEFHCKNRPAQLVKLLDG
jgi:hypothetical protein